MRLLNEYMPLCLYAHVYTLPHKPSLHAIPFHPTTQEQLSGWEQVPPFWHGGMHIADEQNESKHVKLLRS